MRTRDRLGEGNERFVHSLEELGSVGITIRDSHIYRGKLRPGLRDSRETLCGKFLPFSRLRSTDGQYDLIKESKIEHGSRPDSYQPLRFSPRLTSLPVQLRAISERL